MARPQINYDGHALGPGWIALAKQGEYIVSVALTNTQQQALEYFQQRFTEAQLEPASLTHELQDLMALARAEIHHYPHPYRAQGSEFQQAVWQGLLAIPTGHTQTYQQLAQAIGRPRAVRAVGSGCGANPLAVIIPCHRITRSDGALGGFYWGAQWKRYLLAQESRNNHFI